MNAKRKLRRTLQSFSFLQNDRTLCVLKQVYWFYTAASIGIFYRKTIVARNSHLQLKCEPWRLLLLLLLDKHTIAVGESLLSIVHLFW